VNKTLNIATFNIHKGVSHFSARFSLHHQREILRQTSADIVFLQEVRDVHAMHSQRFKTWPEQGQASFLAEAVWPDYAYGKNAVYPAGHHGNALLSKFPIIKHHNVDISAHATEERGMLHCEIQVPHWDEPIHAICVHLGLFAKWRRAQLKMVADYIDSQVPRHVPLMIAGDFNDWSTLAGSGFASRLQLDEVFEQHTGKHARSFPSWMPLLKLDRIYVRGFHIHHAQIHSGTRFLKVSDHAMLTSTLYKK
jgi:endonuclease/exonuclease/phosphatase family metal-dependent hydrolase